MKDFVEWVKTLFSGRVVEQEVYPILSKMEEDG